jgi:hypothetical protein
MFIPLDYFRCANCAEWLRSREVHRGTTCRCSYCGQQQTIPGAKKGFFGKLLIFVGGGGASGDVAFSLCPHCQSETHTFASVCHRCCRDLPPLVG